MEGRIYYHPSFPDRGARIMAELSYSIQAMLPAQRPQSPAGQRAGAEQEVLSERVQRGKVTEEAAAEDRTTC